MGKVHPHEAHVFDRVFSPVFTMVTPLAGLIGIDTPYHAARFVSLLPFKKEKVPGEESSKEIWHSINVVLAKVRQIAPGLH